MTEINLVCNGCNKPLDADFDRKGQLSVDPCQTCLDAADTAAFERGKNEWIEEAEKEANDD